MNVDPFRIALGEAQRLRNRERGPLAVYRDGPTGWKELCASCVDIIRRAGPGTVYAHTDLSAPLPEPAQGEECEHCGRRGE